MRYIMCMMKLATESPAPSLDNLADLTLEWIDNLLNQDDSKKSPRPLCQSPYDLDD